MSKCDRMAKPVKCERCGRENDPTLRTCLDCGRPLVRPPPPPAPARCGRCGTIVLPGFRFCGQCGAELAATPSPGAPAPAAAPAPGPRLTAVRTDGQPGASYPLRSPATVCGRLEGDILLSDDATVSPRHATFSVEGERVTVQDLGSVNGTYLRIRSPHRLESGAELRLGRQLLRLEPLPRPPADGPEARAWGGADPGFRMRLAQLLEGGGLGEIHPLREGENVVGREAGEVVFPGDRYVSARHARIELAGDVATVTDLGSSNGTFCRVSGPTLVLPGDHLLIGAQLLKLEV